MATAKLTLMGLHRWYTMRGGDLFDTLTLPDGIDKDTLTGSILMAGGEFEVLYSNPDTLKAFIEVWSSKWYRTFEKWVAALNIEYDPLNNYDRTENYTDTKERSGSSNASGTTATDSDNENKVSAFDTSSYQPSNYQTGGSTTVSNTSGSDSEKESITHSARIYGNIGVTTSQQMLQSELDIAKWNLYQHITDIFVDEFCIMVY